MGSLKYMKIGHHRKCNPRYKNFASTCDIFSFFYLEVKNIGLVESPYVERLLSINKSSFKSIREQQKYNQIDRREKIVIIFLE